MTLRQLEIFKAIVDTGKFTAAAEKLRVAQPSVSQQIQALEDELGDRLFVRLKNRKVQLTEAGNVLCQHADVILRQCQRARMEISALSREPSGQIRIGVGGHQLTSSLPQALIAFHNRFPKVSVDIVNGTTPHLMDLLRNNRLDLAVVNFPVQTRDLRTEVLFTEELIVAVRKSDPLARKVYISATELAELPLVLYDQTTNTRQRLDQFFRDLGIQPHVVFELSSVEAMKRMVEAGLGATIIPHSVLLDGSDIPKLHPLRIRGKALKRSVGVAMPLFPQLPKVIEVMLQLIKQRFEGIQGALKG